MKRITVSLLNCGQNGGLRETDFFQTNKLSSSFVWVCVLGAFVECLQENYWDTWFDENVEIAKYIFPD